MEVESRKTSGCKRILGVMKKQLLLILMLIAMVIGIGLGLGLRSADPPLGKRGVHYLRFPGDLLLQFLKVMIIPLVVSSLISGVAALDLKSSSKISNRATAYYLNTTLLAAIVGILLVVAIQPGANRMAKNRDESSTDADAVNIADAILDLLRVMFPDNLVTACFQMTITEQVLVTNDPVNMTTNLTAAMTTMAMGLSSDNTSTLAQEEAKVYEPRLITTPGMNVLGLAVFSLFLGSVISRMGLEGKILADFFQALNVAIMQLVTLVIWYSPIGILFLIAARLVEMDDPEVLFRQLGMYCVTVIVGLVIHGFIILPLIYFIVTRKNPYIFIYGMIEALITALATASSYATLPVTMTCLEEKNGVDMRIVKFVAPIGATINMQGTALYEAVAPIFIAQMNNINLTVGQIIIVSITATTAAIGAAGVPGAGLITMGIVLTAVGLPIEDVGLIVAIDWFLDRLRTSVNVLGDAFGAGMVAALSKKELQRMNEESIEQIVDRPVEENGIVTNKYIAHEDDDTPM